MVHSLMPEHLAISNGLDLDGLNQARIIVSPAQHIDRLETGHMRKRSFDAGRNSSTPAVPNSQTSWS
jgi:hypothetical protein